MFTNDELELIKKAVKFYADNDGIEQEITMDILQFVAECKTLAISDPTAGLNLAETRARAATEKRKNIGDRLILLQAKLIKIEDGMVAEDV